MTANKVMTRAELFEAGVSEDVLLARVARGKWRRVFHGVYFLAEEPPVFRDWCVAALVYAGEGARLAGPTAARLFQLDGFTPKDSDDPVGILSVAIPHERRVRPQTNLVVVRVNRMPTEDLAVRRSLPCTTAVRSLIDASRAARWAHVVMAFEHLHRQGKHKSLARRIEALKENRPWLRRLTELMARRGPRAVPTESAAEALCDDILWRAGFRAERQVCVRHGSTARRIDLAFPEVKLGIECDSRMWHTAIDTFEKDRHRWAWLAGQGWQLVHFTWSQLQDEAYVAGTVQRALRARGALRVG